MGEEIEPPGYRPDWEADVILRDGSVAQVRPIRPSDAEALQAFHMAQSDESIYLRFFAPLKRLSDKDLHRFTHVDYLERVALIIIANDQLVAVGRYDRLGGPDGAQAEVAFNVSDHLQGRGLGSVLLEHLAAIGREAGVEEFVADVLPQNRKMMSVFIDAGFQVNHHFDDGVISLSFPIVATEASEDVRLAREQRAESASVRALLTPASVAVIGVSRRRGSAGREVLSHIVEGGFAGRLYAVGSTDAAEPIDGHPVYGSVTDIPEPVELAVIAVPAAAVHEVVSECATIGVKAVVVISSGFAESGPEGAALQADLLRTARRHGMRVVGPNSFGVINARREVALNASLAPALPAQGSLGLFSQSGALAIAVLESAARRGLGLSDFVSAGNRVDVSGNDAMQYWIDDESTSAVGMYLESMGNPRKFNRIARQLARSKPVIVVKSGASTHGVPAGHKVRATQSRPGAFQAMLRQAGVIRVDNVHQMFDIAQLVVHQPIPGGPRVAVVGNSDALTAIAADACVGHDLQVTHGPRHVPVDASSADLRQLLQDAFDDEQVDSVVTAFTPAHEFDGARIATIFAQVAAASDKPCITTFVGFRGLTDELSAGRTTDGRPKTVPAYSMPEDGVRALSSVVRYGQYRARDRGELVNPAGIDRHGARMYIDKVLQETPEGRELTPIEAEEFLAFYGITLWPAYHVRSARAAAYRAASVGFPVVVKSISPEVRSQPVTSVRTDLMTMNAVRAAYRLLDERLAPLGANHMVVQRMATPGIPCVVATAEDPLFGPLVRFSIGGAPTDVMGDFGYRIPPLRENDITDLIDSVRAAPLLSGAGGRPPIDRHALADVIARVSLLADHHPDVAGLEINPVNCHADGAEVLGARVHLAPAQRSDTDRRALTGMA